MKGESEIDIVRDKVPYEREKERERESETLRKRYIKLQREREIWRIESVCKGESEIDSERETKCRM